MSASEGRHKPERRELPLLQSIKRCGNLCNALLNWEFMILAAEIYGVSGKLFIPAANGCLFIVTAKTKRTKKKQLWQNFLLPTSSVLDTYAILIAVVDQTVLESVMDTFALVMSVTQLNLFYTVFSKSVIIKPIRRTILIGYNAEKPHFTSNLTAGRLWTNVRQHPLP